MGDFVSNPAAFEQLVQQLQSSDNGVRNSAEALFEQLKSSPDPCVTCLVQCMRSSQIPDNRMFSAIMLRKVFSYKGTGQTEFLWNRCSPHVQAGTKNELLSALAQEQLKPVVSKVCDTISDLAALIYEDPGWPELLPALFQCIQSSQPQLLVSALNIMADLAHYVGASLKGQLPHIIQTLGALLSHPLAEVQLAAVRLATSFIEVLEEPADRDKFQPTLEPILAFLGKALTDGDESSARDILQMFNDVAMAHPRFLRSKLVQVVDAMLQIANAQSLDADTRIGAAEFLVTLTEAREKAPGMMRKLPQFTERLFAVLMAFLLDVEDDPLWHSSNDEEHEDAGDGDLHIFGQECLDRVALSLGGNSVVAAAGGVLMRWIVDQSDWRKRYAVFICLAQIAEGCVRVMAKQLDQLTAMCVNGLRDPHPKVRWAACQALGQMCTDLGPDIQDKHHATILPALSSVMDDFANPRVQAHACAAVVNFSESVDSDVLLPYLDALILKLLTLLQSGKKLVQEGALTALASVADSSQALFVKYYDMVMPLLYHILTGATDKSHRLLRAKALECISLVGMAVGKERFRNDARNVMAFLQQLQQAGLDADDPTMGYMLQAGARLCKCLGQEFLPYLDIVMPSLLKSAKLDPDLQICDSDDEIADDGEREAVDIGGRMLTYRSSVLEEKATAASMLTCYADELKEGFAPYVQDVAAIMVPLAKFFLSEDVRRAAVQIMPELLRSYVLAIEKGQWNVEPSWVASLLNTMWPQLIQALNREPDVEVAASMLETMGEIVELVDRSLLSGEQIQSAFDVLKRVLQEADERRVERLKRQHTEDFDEEELEALEEENEMEEEVFDQVGTTLGTFLKKYGDDVLGLVEGVMMAHYAPLLTDKRSDEERRIAVCLVDDLLENSPAGRTKYCGQVMPVLMECCSSTHPDLRQCAVYGLGVLAAKAPELFQAYAQRATELIVAILNHPEAREEDNAMATDNAVSALGKLLESQPATAESSALAALWVKSLPLKADHVEAQAMHEQLTRMVEAQDPRILGPGNSHLAQLVTVMVEVLGHGTQLVAGDVGKRMAALLHQLQGSVPGDVVQGAMTSLTPKQQAHVTTYLSGQIPQADS